MSASPVFSLLDSIASPADLRRLPESALPELAAELREFLICTTAGSGGHFAASLGTVELTIALHYVFDTPRDSLVWDVGHQCYGHKVLTGRRNGIAAIRRRCGLSGFLRREESPFDAFGAGHSSTSISAALGMAVANSRQGCDHDTVAVIGDGSLTAGLAFEALNHAGVTAAKLLVVVNDNGMSISPNVGALSRTFHAGQPQPGGADAATQAASWFAPLGFPYRGLCDGHDLGALVAVLRELRGGNGPRLLHVRTEKGHGYAPAAADPVRYHGVTPFDPSLGIQPPKSAPAPTYTDVFGAWVCQAADRDPRLAVVTPAMREGSGLARFAERHPDRFFDVGIAEQHAVTFAAGLACRGMRPVVAIYSTFLQRAYDQLVHDVALQKLPVIFAIDRGGLVGPDGATHNGSYDLSYLRCVPGLVIMTPADGQELRRMLDTALRHDGPVAIRYPRTAAAPGQSADDTPEVLPIGSARVLRRGTRIAILAFGTLLDAALKAAAGLDATVVDMRFVKPLDAQTVLEVARAHEWLVTLEENAAAGGAGSAVAELLATLGQRNSLLQLGLPDRTIEHGTRDEALRDAGLDGDGILAAIERAALPVDTSPRQLQPAPAPAHRTNVRVLRPRPRP
jgi:1-deoxy-D-xylulose-5-phosphate synthase